MTVAGSGEKWRWADPNGLQRLVHIDELRAALAGGSLPPYTLVWREGMAEWEPAYQVAELATVAISAQQGVIPKIPPPPLSIVAVQAEFERQGPAVDGVKRDAARKEQEPPPPPIDRYPDIIAEVPAHVVASARSPQAAPVPQEAPPHPAAPSTKAGEASPSPAPFAAAPTAPVVPPPPTSARTSSTTRAATPGPPIASVLPNLPNTRGSAAPRPPPRHHHPAPASHPPAGLSSLPPLVQPPFAFVPGGQGSQPARLVASNGADGTGADVWPRIRAEETASAPAGTPAAGPESTAPTMLQQAPPASTSAHDLPAFPLEEPEPSDPGATFVVTDEAGTPLRPGLGEKLDVWLKTARKTAGPIAVRMKAGALRAKDVVARRAAPAVRESVRFAIAHPKDPRVIASAGGAALVLLLLVIALVSAGSKSASNDEAATTPAAIATRETAEPANTANTAPAAETEVAPAAGRAEGTQQLPSCRRTRDPVRLAQRASKDVPLEVAVAEGRARIGFSPDGFSALGVSVDAATSKVVVEFGAKAGKVNAVIPNSTQSKPAYVVDAEGRRDRIRGFRTVSTEPPFVVGFADNAFSGAARPTDAPHAIWPLDGDEAPDAIQTADLGSSGAAVVFRRHGSIYGGIIEKSGAAHGELIRIQGGEASVGSPIGAPRLAVSGQVLAVAFAARTSLDEPWGIRLGTAALGAFPREAAPFSLPKGGPGGPAIAPRLSGLGDGRFLLVWTEGSGGDHDVRAQTLSKDLTPVGEPFTVSHPASNAGQGAVAMSAGQGFVSYLALTPRGYELWGAFVDCR